MQPVHPAASRFISKGNDFIPTGIPSLDTVIGGGYPVGSLILINEDELGSYSDLFLQVFIAQGIYNKDKIIFASKDENTNYFIERLPEASDSVVENAENEATLLGGSMQIAWRYETNYKPRVDISKHKSLSSNFYFKGPTKAKPVDTSKVIHWPGKDGGNTFSDLVKVIVATILNDNQTTHLGNKKDRNTLRIAIHHLGSTFWEDKEEELPALFYQLRSISQLSRCTILITLPKHLIQKQHYAVRCEQLSDIVLELEALDGKGNPLFNDYNGLIKFIKVSPMNSLCTNITEGKDWAFKLIKKKLLIERLTLPPELSTSAQREQDTFSCNSTLQKSLQF